MKAGAWALFAAAAGGLGLALWAGAKSRAIKGRTVLHLGDSHVAGLAPHVRALLLAKGATYVVDSVVGISTSGYAASGRIVPLVQMYAPALVVVTLGTNDRGPSEEAVRAVVSTVRRVAPDARVVWWGPPALPRRPDLAQLLALVAGAARTAIRKAGGTYVDSGRYTKDAELYAPGRPPVEWIHLTREGYRRWAEGALEETL